MFSSELEGEKESAIRLKLIKGIYEYINKKNYLDALPLLEELKPLTIIHPGSQNEVDEIFDKIYCFHHINLCYYELKTTVANQSQIIENFKEIFPLIEKHYPKLLEQKKFSFPDMRNGFYTLHVNIFTPFLSNGLQKEDSFKNLFLCCTEGIKFNRNHSSQKQFFLDVWNFFVLPKYRMEQSFIEEEGFNKFLRWKENVNKTINSKKFSPDNMLYMSFNQSAIVEHDSDYSISEKKSDSVGYVKNDYLSVEKAAMEELEILEISDPLKKSILDLHTLAVKEDEKEYAVNNLAKLQIKRTDEYHELLKLHCVNDCFLSLGKTHYKKDEIIKNFEKILKIIDNKKITQNIRDDEYHEFINDIYWNHVEIFYFLSGGGNNKTVEEIENFEKFIDCGIKGIEINNANKASQQRFAKYLNEKIPTEYKISPLSNKEIITSEKLTEWKGAIYKKIEALLYENAKKTIEKEGYSLKAKESVKKALEKFRDRIDLLSKLNKLTCTILLARCYKEESNLKEAINEFKSAIDQLKFFKGGKNSNIPQMWLLHLEYSLVLFSSLVNNYDKELHQDILQKLQNVSDSKDCFQNKEEKGFFNISPLQILQTLAQKLQDACTSDKLVLPVEFLECLLEKIKILNEKAEDEKVKSIITSSEKQLKQLKQQRASLEKVTKKIAEQQPKKVEEKSTGFSKEIQPIKTPEQMRAEKEEEEKRAKKAEKAKKIAALKQAQENEKRKAELELARLEEERQREQEEREKREAFRKKYQEKSKNKKGKLKNELEEKRIVVSEKAARKKAAAKIKNNPLKKKDEIAEEQERIAILHATIQQEDKERAKKLAERKKKQMELKIENIDRDLFREVPVEEKIVDEAKEAKLKKDQKRYQKALRIKAKEDNRKEAKAKEARLLKIEKEKEEKEANIRRQAEDARLLKIKKDQQEKEAAKRSQ